MSTALSLLGDLYRRVGDLEQAETYLQQSLDVATGIDFDMLASDSLVGLALVADERGRHLEAERFADGALEAARRAQSPLAEARALLTRGGVLLAAGRIDAAEAALQSCVALSREVGLANLVLEAHAALAVAALRRGDAAEALRLVEDLLQHLGAAGLEGCLRPADVYRNCWRVLAARHDTRTASVLLAAGSYLYDVADRIDEDDLKHGFLQNVPANAELLAARTAVTS